eukprot:COSAG01_NODE_768_length_13739_cov_6.271334_19_plen_90_part_00
MLKQCEIEAHPQPFRNKRIQLPLCQSVSEASRHYSLAPRALVGPTGRTTTRQPALPRPPSSSPPPPLPSRPFLKAVYAAVVLLVGGSDR